MRPLRAVVLALALLGACTSSGTRSVDATRVSHHDGTARGAADTTSSDDDEAPTDAHAAHEGVDRAAPTTADGAPTTRDVTPRDSSAPSSSVCQPWPEDPADPRVGIYVYERTFGPPHDGEDELVFYFDGESVPHRWMNYLDQTLRVVCTYSDEAQLAEVPASGGHRYRAEIDDQSWLWVLEPCIGWRPMGRFVDGGFETRRTRFRRLPPGAMEELYRSPRRDVDVDFYFRCHPLYVSRTQPTPPRPTEPVPAR